MNKIFKIVFNAARGKMMVVNEATSSVQTGKKAAVTVAVIGALSSSVAFSAPITGPLTQDVYGKSEVIETGTHTFSSLAPIVLEKVKANTGLYVVGGAVQTSAKDSTVMAGAESNINEETFASGVTIRDSEFAGTSYIIGAGLLEKNENAKKYHTSTYYGSYVDLQNVKAEESYVIGGGKIGKQYGSKIYGSTSADLTVTHTNVKLTGETVVHTVVGGSFVSGSKTTNSQVITGKTDIYIGQGVKVIDKVVGGNLGSVGGKNATVQFTNIEVEGADLSTAKLIGGNYFNSASPKIAVDSMTTKTNITIKDSVVRDLYATDYVVNSNAGKFYDTATTDVSVKIENSTIKGNVIGGTYAKGVNIEADVEQKITLDLNNVRVEGTVTTDNLVEDLNENKTFVENSIKESDISLTNVQAKAVVASKGTLNLRAVGDGTTSIGTLDVTVPEGNMPVTVRLTTDGAANDAAAGDITKAIVVGSGDYSAEVNMEEGMYYGEVTGKIDNGKVNVVHAANSLMTNVLDMASVQSVSLNRVLMNDVRKRLGDIRAAEGTHGVWARYDGGKLSGSNEYENDFTTVQVGIDTVPVVDAPRFGVAFAYTTSDADMKRGGADMDAFSLAFYGTKMYDNGMFVDVIGRMATADTDVVVDGDKKGSMDNVALSLSGELGWRFDVTDKFYFEPQAELTYTYVNADKLALSSGHEYTFDAVDSLVGRVGFATGFKCPNNFGDVYVRASAVHEFLGDATVRGGTAVHEIDGEDTWVEFGIGANFNVNKNTYVYADIERTEGAAMDEDWRANVGVRFAF